MTVAQLGALLDEEFPKARDTQPRGTVAELMKMRRMVP